MTKQVKKGAKSDHVNEKNALISALILEMGVKCLVLFGKIWFVVITLTKLVRLVSLDTRHLCIVGPALWV